MCWLDQILLTHLERIPLTVKRFVHELFSLARKTRSLLSAVLALQRLIAQPLVKTLDRSTILNQEISAHQTTWQEIGDILIRTPLLTESEKIELLAKYQSFWDGRRRNRIFRKHWGH